MSLRVCPQCAEEFSEDVDTCPNDGTPTQALDPTVVRPVGPAPKAKASARASSQRVKAAEAPATNESTNKDLARVATGAAAAYAPATAQTPAHQAERTNVAPMPTADHANVAPPAEPTVVAEGAEDGPAGDAPFGLPLRPAPASPPPPSEGVGRRPTGVEGIPLETTPGSRFGQAADPLIGVTVGEYVIKGALGEGGMGMVYEAVHPILGKRVAIKCLREEVAANPEEAARLLSEAKTAIAIGHRGIIDIFGFGSLPDGRQYFVMEYLNGEPLADRIRPDKELPLGEVLVLMEEILSPLGAAHAAGVIHRDLKPTNIYVVKQPDGATFIKLLDFGLAKQAAVPRGHSAQTNVARILGTPEFMAPEQARGEPVSPRTDLYAFGVIAYELLTAKAPFWSESPWETISMHLTQPPPKVSALRPDVPPMVDSLVQRLMAKEPSARPASAEVVREEVRRMRKALKLEGTRLELPIVKGRSVNAGVLGPPQLAPVGPAAASRAERPQPSAKLPVPPRASSPGRAAQDTAVIPSRKAAAEAVRAGAPAAAMEESAEDLPQVRSSRTGLVVGLLVLVALAVAGGGWWLFGGAKGSGSGPADDGLSVKAPSKLEALPEHVPPPEPPKTPEPPKAVEAPKTVEAPEPPKTVEPPKTEDVPKTVETPKTVGPPKTVEAPEPPKATPPAAVVKPPSAPRDALAGRLARVRRAWGAARRSKPDDDVRLFDQMLQTIEQENKAAGADKAAVRKGLDAFVVNALDGKEP